MKRNDDIPSDIRPTGQHISDEAQRPGGFVEVTTEAYTVNDLELAVDELIKGMKEMIYPENIDDNQENIF